MEKKYADQNQQSQKHAGGGHCEASCSKCHSKCSKDTSHNGPHNCQAGHSW